MRTFLFTFLFVWNSIHLFAGDSKDFIRELKKITDIMIFDVTSPVAAARYYAYSTLAAYETLANNYPDSNPSFSNITQINFEKNDGSPIPMSGSCPIYSMMYTASKLLPSGKKLNQSLDSLKFLLTENEILLAEKIGNTILSYATKDGFVQLNNLKRYTPKRGQGYWQPTPPTFMAPVEPHWNTVKTFFLKSPDQFITKRPIEFNTNPGSDFYEIAMDVKKVVEENNKKRNIIASFWDCNPYAISQIGHIEFGIKKISPGGHWISITGIACHKKKLSLEKTIFAHTIVSISLHDSFVACWDEKYRSHRIRPETIINQVLDPSWKPLLQTPPFPEYVSGHAVVSTATAIILTEIFGDNFNFKDDSEVEFGLKTRKFKSFKQAASEASISRFYGGIHYMDAITEGENLGKNVAEFILNQTKDYFKYSLDN